MKAKVKEEKYLFQEKRISIKMKSDFATLQYAIRDVVISWEGQLGLLRYTSCFGFGFTAFLSVLNTTYSTFYQQVVSYSKNLIPGMDEKVENAKAEFFYGH